MLTVNVRETGAVADGKTLDTAAIQKAIDSCSKNGGGRVYVPAGQYYVGKIILKDNIIFEIAGGAELIASNDFENDYPNTTLHDESLFPAWEKIDGEKVGDPRKWGLGVIFASEAKNIKITGQGCINGNFKNILIRRDKDSGYISKYRWKETISDLDERYTVDWSNPPFRRPVAIYLDKCENVVLEDISVKDSSMYTCNFRSCKDVIIRNFTIDNYVGADNADGLHFSSCEDVRITGCTLRCGDDCIAIDSNDMRPSRKFMIDNCLFNSRNNCFRLFTGLCDGTKRELCKNGVVSDVVINNCTVENASAFANLHGDGGTIERVSVSNCAGRVDRIGTVFLVQAHLGGTVRNVTFSGWNIESNGVGYIYADDKSKISDVRISNMNLHIKPKTKMFGNGFDMGINSIGMPLYYYSHFAPYFLQITGADKVQISDVSIIWGVADLYDMQEMIELKEKEFPAETQPWDIADHWPAIYVNDSRDILGRNIVCEPFGEDETVKIVNSENVKISKEL